MSEIKEWVRDMRARLQPDLFLGRTAGQWQETENERDRLQVRVRVLESALMEAMGWNWLDEDAPEDVRERLVRVWQGD